jgi:hypothetical protein
LEDAVTTDVEGSDRIERWMAKRRMALVLSMVKAEGSVWVKNRGK